LRILELFAGSRSVGKAGHQLGHEVFSIDIEKFYGIDLVSDIEFLDLLQLPDSFDMGWASPSCTSYSLLAVSHHRDIQKPKTEFAEKSDRLVKRTLEIFSYYEKVNPFFLWYLENPRGLLRKMDFMLGIPRTTVTYCSYGDNRMKPTDIWSNNIFSLFNQDGWQPRSMCFNGNYYCHHEKAPRGSRLGTQGLSSSFERSKIPHDLCIDIIKSTEKKYLMNLL